jgi:hypothetical protein
VLQLRPFVPSGVKKPFVLPPLKLLVEVVPSLPTGSSVTMMSPEPAVPACVTKHPAMSNAIASEDASIIRLRSATMFLPVLSFRPSFSG